MLLDLVLYPDNRLNLYSEDVPEDDITKDGVKELALNMIETMKFHKGIGLSAPQIGKNLRMVVIDTSEHQPHLKHKCPIIMINPNIAYEDKGLIGTMSEGCLSFPNVFHMVRRSHKIIVSYKNLKGDSCIDLFTGITAVCVQHEIDHLDGITMDKRSEHELKPTD